MVEEEPQQMVEVKGALVEERPRHMAVALTATAAVVVQHCRVLAVVAVQRLVLVVEARDERSMAVMGELMWPVQGVFLVATLGVVRLLEEWNANMGPLQ